MCLKPAFSPLFYPYFCYISLSADSTRIYPYVGIFPAVFYPACGRQSIHYVVHSACIAVTRLHLLPVRPPHGFSCIIFSKYVPLLMSFVLKLQRLARCSSAKGKHCVVFTVTRRYCAFVPDASDSQQALSQTICLGGPRCNSFTLLCTANRTQDPISTSSEQTALLWTSPLTLTKLPLVAPSSEVLGGALAPCFPLDCNLDPSHNNDWGGGFFNIPCPPPCWVDPAPHLSSPRNHALHHCFFLLLLTHICVNKANIFHFSRPNYK